MLIGKIKIKDFVKNWDNPQTMEGTMKCIDKHDRNENKQTGKLSNRYETIRGIFYLTAEGYSCNHAEWDFCIFENYQDFSQFPKHPHGLVDIGQKGPRLEV